MPSPPVRLSFTDEDYKTAIVGESYRQPELEALDARTPTDHLGRKTFVAGLRAEPDNPHDKNAVAVVAVDTGAQLGYFSRELAPTYQSALLKRGGARYRQPSWAAPNESRPWVSGSTSPP